MTAIKDFEVIMGWADKAVKDLRNGRSVIVQPFYTSLKDKFSKEETLTLEPCKAKDLKIGDLVIVRVKGVIDLSAITSIENGTFRVGPLPGSNSDWVDANAIFGRANARETLFTKDELVQAKNQNPNETNNISIEYLKFDHRDFPSLSSEESFWFFWELKKDYSHPVQFWLKVLEQLEIGNTFADVNRTDELCEFWLPANFSTEVNAYFKQLKTAKPVTEDVVKAMRMYNIWNEHGAIGETANYYLAFYWETSA